MNASSHRTPEAPKEKVRPSRILPAPPGVFQQDKDTGASLLLSPSSPRRESSQVTSPSSPRRAHATSQPSPRRGLEKTGSLRHPSTPRKKVSRLQDAIEEYEMASSSNSNIEFDTAPGTPKTPEKPTASRVLSSPGASQREEESPQRTRTSRSSPRRASLSYATSRPSGLTKAGSFRYLSTPARKKFSSLQDALEEYEMASSSISNIEFDAAPGTPKTPKKATPSLRVLPSPGVFQREVDSPPKTRTSRSSNPRRGMEKISSLRNLVTPREKISSLQDTLEEYEMASMSISNIEVDAPETKKPTASSRVISAPGTPQLEISPPKNPSSRFLPPPLVFQQEESRCPERPASPRKAMFKSVSARYLASRRQPSPRKPCKPQALSSIADAIDEYDKISSPSMLEI
jgi:hypothetical protein